MTRVAEFKDANGIDHSVLFVDTFASEEECDRFVSALLGTTEWRFTA